MRHAPATGHNNKYPDTTRGDRRRHLNTTIPNLARRKVVGREDNTALRPFAPLTPSTPKQPPVAFFPGPAPQRADTSSCWTSVTTARAVTSVHVRATCTNARSATLGDINTFSAPEELHKGTRIIATGVGIISQV